MVPQIVVLNFNGWEDTIACLESLKKVKGEKQIILIDNGSSNNSVQELSTWDEENGFFCESQDIEGREGALSPQLVNTSGHVFIRSRENFGFAGGNNLGTDLANARQQPYVLLLNNDTVVAPDFLSELAAVSALHPEAVLVPQIRLHDQPTLLWNCGGKIKWPGRKTYNYGNAPVSSLPSVRFFSVDFVTGCALWFKPEIHGRLSEDFFFGEEDMDFSLRLKEMKMEAFCVLTSVIYHKVGSSLARNAKKSMIFTLKRLVNLRNHLDLPSYLAARAFYLGNLYRLLTLHYKLSFSVSLRATRKISKLSRMMHQVSKAFCVDYVRGNSDLLDLPEEDLL